MLWNEHVHWRVASDGALAWREWDGEVVVFNQNTGNTHLLGDLAGAVLLRLISAGRGATVESLATGLTDDPSQAGADTWMPAVAKVLSEFARLGLAHPDMS